MKEFIELYDKLGFNKVDDLYYYGCLKLSGFDKEKAYELISLLSDLYIKDESGSSISKISDSLFDNYEYLDIDNMSTREILCELDLGGF